MEAEARKQIAADTAIERLMKDRETYESDRDCTMQLVEYIAKAERSSRPGRLLPEIEELHLRYEREGHISTQASEKVAAYLVYARNWLANVTMTRSGRVIRS